MPAERFYLKNSSLNELRTILLQDEEFHHLSHVMRLRVGETVELINGMGELAVAEILAIEKKQAILRIHSFSSKEAPSFKLILAQALPRLPRLEYILEKSVELGVTDLWLFPGELSEKKDLSSTSQLERVNHITTSAMKQCGRLFAPTILMLPSLIKWDPKTLPSLSFFGDTSPSAPLFYQALQDCPKGSSLLIAIGPEKGLSEKETSFMKDSLHMQGVKLHDNILRTDTAAIASLAIAAASLAAKI